MESYKWRRCWCKCHCLFIFACSWGKGKIFFPNAVLGFVFCFSSLKKTKQLYVYTFTYLQDESRRGIKQVLQSVCVSEGLFINDYGSGGHAQEQAHNKERVAVAARQADLRSGHIRLKLVNIRYHSLTVGTVTGYQGIPVLVKAPRRLIRLFQYFYLISRSI